MLHKNRKEVITPAQIIFKDKDILTARPEGMDYESYRILRGTANKVIKKLFPKSYKTR